MPSGLLLVAFRLQSSAAWKRRPRRGKDGLKGHYEEGHAALSTRESCQRQVVGVPPDEQSQLRAIVQRFWHELIAHLGTLDVADARENVDRDPGRVPAEAGGWLPARREPGRDSAQL